MEKYVFRNSIKGEKLESMPDDLYAILENRNYLVLDYPSDPDTRKLFYQKMEGQGVNSAYEVTLKEGETKVDLIDNVDTEKFIGVFVDGLVSEDWQLVGNQIVFDEPFEEDKTILIWYSSIDGETSSYIEEPFMVLHHHEIGLPIGQFKKVKFYTNGTLITAESDNLEVKASIDTGEDPYLTLDSYLVNMWTNSTLRIGFETNSSDLEIESDYTGLEASIDFENKQIVLTSIESVASQPTVTITAYLNGLIVARQISVIIVLEEPYITLDESEKLVVVGRSDEVGFKTNSQDLFAESDNEEVTASLTLSLSAKTMTIPTGGKGTVQVKTKET